MSNAHPSSEPDTEGALGTYGCSCESHDARMCYVIRYDVEPADDSLDDGRCDCLCHKWHEDDA